MPDKPATLYVVATPIGNLQDMTPRALDVLENEVDVVFAEDTRVAKRLASAFGLSIRVDSLHAHNESRRISKVLEHLESNRSVALLSDAGTPAISDPGAKLVEACHEAHFRVTPVVGASALVAALSVSGYFQNDSNELFLGFLASDGKPRRKGLERAINHFGSVVLFEAPHRIDQTLSSLEALGEGKRSACLCRELSKKFEEVLRSSVSELRTSYFPRKGEMVLVLGPKEEARAADIEERAQQAMLEKLISQGLSKRDASIALSVCLKLSKKDVYRLANAL